VPKVPQDHLEARRAQILEAARAVFAQYGYEGATLVRLEQATGLSRGAIFHYFADKQTLFAALGASVNRHYVEAITGGGYAEAIREIACESPDLLAVLLEAEVRVQRDEDFKRRMEPTTAELGRKLEAWFQEQRETGGVRTDLDWRHLARFAAIVINGLAFRLARGDETDVETVVQLLEEALLAEPPPRRSP